MQTGFKNVYRTAVIRVDQFYWSYDEGRHAENWRTEPKDAIWIFRIDANGQRIERLLKDDEQFLLVLPKRSE